MFKRVMIILGYLLVVTQLSYAQPAPQVPENKQELIMRFIEANGTREGMIKILNQLIQEAPAAEQEQLKSLLKVDDIIKELVPIYDRYYTEDDLKELVTFYKGPTGQKAISVTPKIMQEATQVMVKYFQEKIPAEKK